MKITKLPSESDLKKEIKIYRKEQGKISLQTDSLSIG